MRSWPLPTRFAMWAAVAVAPLVACGDNNDAPVPPPRTIAPSPTEGVDSPALAALLVEHWDLEAALDPFDATYIGDHRVDAELPPVRRDDVLALRTRRRALLAQASSLAPPALSARDELTHAILVERLAATADLDVCDYEHWAVSPRKSSIRRFDNIGAYHPLLATEDADSYLAR